MVNGALGLESGRKAEGREDLGFLKHRIPADSLGGDGEDLECVQFVSATDTSIGGEPGLAVGRHRLQTPIRTGLPENPFHEQDVVPGPANQLTIGGISMTTSSVSSRLRPSMSARSNAFM